MKITLLNVGKTSYSFVEEACNLYFNRLNHYTRFDVLIVDDVKNGGKLLHNDLKIKEGKKILSKISNTDFVVLLDEKGKPFTSIKFAEWIEQQQVQSMQHLVFIIGGAFGFSEDVYKRANMKLQLSAMTFSHQIIRIIFAEQLYRAFTIIKGEPYHNA